MKTNNSKVIGYLLIGLIIVALIAVMYTILVDVEKDPAPADASQQNIERAINDPVEVNESWKTLARTDEYEISYSEVGENRSFFITVNAQPALEVSKKAEQALLETLGIDQDTACGLPLSMGVPSAVDGNLSGYTFGLSFCFGKDHISDVQ